MECVFGLLWQRRHVWKIYLFNWNFVDARLLRVVDSERDCDFCDDNTLKKKKRKETCIGYRMDYNIVYHWYWYWYWYVSLSLCIETKQIYLFIECINASTTDLMKKGLVAITEMFLKNNPGFNGFRQHKIHTYIYIFENLELYTNSPNWWIENSKAYADPYKNRSVDSDEQSQQIPNTNTVHICIRMWKQTCLRFNSMREFSDLCQWKFVFA